MMTPEILTKLKALLQSEVTRGELELPILPDVAVNILSKPLGVDTDVHVLSEMIHRDQSLAAHVLKAVNSAAFASNKNTISLKQAVVRLGMNYLREIVLAVAFKSRLFASARYESYLQEQWQVSAVTAAYAREIAIVCNQDPEVAFLCGLLHNVDKPALLMKMVDLQRTLRITLDCVETLDLFPEFSTPVKELIAQKWALPDEVKTAITHLDRWQDVKVFESTTQITAMAILFANFVFDPGTMTVAKAHELPLSKVLQLTEKSIATLVSKRDKVEAFAESFG
jgi:HD-like signal output (HDOD) protein